MTRKSPIQEPAIFENLKAEQYLSTKEVATYLGVSEKTVRGWHSKGLLIPDKVGPRLNRYKMKDIELWISKSKGDSDGNE